MGSQRVRHNLVANTHTHTHTHTNTHTHTHTHTHTEEAKVVKSFPELG